MITLRQYQFDGIREIRRAFAAGFKSPLYVLPTGAGKCLGRGTPVLMFNGRIVPVEEVKAGDWLMGPDSRPRAVLSTCSGIEPLYKVLPVKGEPYVVNESHILSLHRANDGSLRDGSLIENVSVLDYLKKSRNWRNVRKGWRARVDFTPPAYELPIPAYILGIWLGDGTSNIAAITSADPEVITAWAEYVGQLGMLVRIEQLPENKAVNVHAVQKLGFSGGIVGGNPLMKKLRHLGVLLNKHVPHRYLVGSRAERSELLAGLIDTDGSIHHLCCDFINKNEQLADAVCFLARSLGLAAYKSPCSKRAQTGDFGRYFRVSISGDLSVIPMRIGRKQCAPRRQIKNVLLTGIRIEPIGVGEYFGFELDGDGLFLLGDFTVTHNTVMFSAIAESSEKRGKRVLILAHRVELVDQIVTSLATFNVKPAVIAAGYCNSRAVGGRTRENHAAVSVASVQTMVRRLDHYPPPTMVICDEAHHCAAGNTWASIIRYYAGAKVLGVTATPCRLDGRGLGAHFDRLIVGPSVAELTAAGYLIPARVFAPPTVDTSGLHIRAGDYKTDEAEALMDVPSITGDALSHYRKHADGLPALVFCTSVQHAHHVADRFRRGGVDSIALDGGTHRDVRRMAVADFRRGAIKVLASCDLFSEGFDVPGVHCGIMLRPTTSQTLGIQQVGRILRPSPGKTHAIILDHVGNTMRFGLPSEPRDWTLTADAVKRKRKPELTVRICPKCWAASPGRATKCVECGVVFEIKPRQEVEEREGELVELTAEQIARKKERSLQGRSRTLAELEAFAKTRNYPPLWAKHVWEAREAKKIKESA